MKIEDLVPLNNLLIVEVVPESAYDNGIYVGKRLVDKPLIGNIVSAGAEVKLCGVNTKVLFGVQAGVNYAIDEKQYRLLREPELLAYLK